jgi:hypothetical protein
VPARAELSCARPQAGSDVGWSIGANKPASSGVVFPVGVQMTFGQVNMLDIPDALAVLSCSCYVGPFFQRTNAQGDLRFAHEKFLTLIL